MNGKKEHKDPFDYTYEELEELSKKPREERTEEEEKALAESRFTQFIGKNSVNEETWDILKELGELMEEKKKKRNGNKNN